MAGLSTGIGRSVLSIESDAGLAIFFGECRNWGNRAAVISALNGLPGLETQKLFFKFPRKGAIDGPGTVLPQTVGPGFAPHPLALSPTRTDSDVRDSSTAVPQAG